MIAELPAPGEFAAFHVEHPPWLIALLLIVPVAWTGLRWLSTMSIARRVSAVLLRSALIVVVVAALSGAAMVGPADRFAVILVADVSGSVSSTGSGTSAARALADRLDVGRGPDDLLGIVLFDGRASSLALPTAGSIGERSWEMAGADGTDIERALRFGSALVPAGASGRVLLLSDGNQTSGDAIGAASELASRGIRVDVVPIESATGPEVVVDRVDVPTRASSGATITARVHLRATAEATGALRVMVNGEPAVVALDERGGGATLRRVEVPRGESIQLVELTLGAGRVHTIEAEFVPEGGGDTVPANNLARASVLTPGTGSILIIDGVGGGDEGGEGATLLRPFRDAGLDVRLVTPEGAPADLVAFEAFDLVILQNVAASALEEPAQLALASAVRDLGVGMVMIGGPTSFGAGGWRASEIEPLLPVLLDLPDRVVVPEAAIVFVLDSSGSMRRRVLGSTRTQQQVANEAAALAVRTLDATDLVGVIHFSDQTSVLVPLGPNTDAEASAQKILEISPDGGTDVREALVEAGRQLREADAKVKHVVVLSDGQSQGAEVLPEYAAQLAAEGVQVSTISVGDGADVGTMREMAERGGGVFYNVINPSRLPRVFLKVVEVVRSPLVKEGRFTPVVTSSGSPLTGDMGTAPDLLGLVLTRARPEPTVSLAMTTPEGEPLLAHWPVELGRVAAFTSDTGRWASEWIGWEGFAPFWVRVARVIGRTPFASPMELTITQGRGGLGIALDAIDVEGTPVDGLDVVATVYRQDAGGAPVEAPLRQTAPGRYEGSVGATPGGSYVVLARARQGDRLIAPMMGVATAAPGAEHASLGTDIGVLERIASASGGSMRTAETVDVAWAFDRAGVAPRRVLRPLWRLLLPWILVLMVMDVATRRIAWDRLVSERYGEGLRRRAREATTERGRGSERTLGTLREAVRGEGRNAGDRGTIALNEQDGARVRREQEAERLAARVEEARKRAGFVVPVKSEPRGETPPASREIGDGKEESGLLAAKRRARERIEKEQKGEG